MAKIRRGNVILRIDDKDIQYYLTKGYTLIDEYGTVLQRTMSKDVNTLQSEVAEKTARLESLEIKLAEKDAEIYRLKEELAQLKQKKNKAK